MPVAQIYRILPEVLLTLTGVAIMLIDPLLPQRSSRKLIGDMAVLGVVAALAASLYQLRLPPGTAYFGIVQTDAFSIFFHVLICSIVLASLLVSLNVVDKAGDGAGEYYALIAFGAVGMLLMTAATELLLVFIGLEISSISTYILAAFRKNSGKSTEAGLKYFLLGSFATAFFLYGIALTFGATGTTKISEVCAQLAQGPVPPMAYLAVAMMLVGLGFKVSSAPFHVWTPDVYEGAPSPVVGLMSTAPKAAVFAVLLRILYDAYPSIHAFWFVLVWLMAAISMTIGNLGALRQQNVKRMMAYSSIAHGGYLLAAFTALSPQGVAAAIFYTAAYAAATVGIFAVFTQAGGYEDRLTSYQDYRGLGYRSPLLGGALTLFLLSMIGIPFTAGFFGKFYVFAATLHSGVIWLTILGLLNSGLAAFYYLRLVTLVYSKPEEHAPVEKAPQFSARMAFVLLFSISATLLLGIFPGRVLSLAQAAAADVIAAGANAEAPSLAALAAPVATSAK